MSRQYIGAGFKIQGQTSAGAAIATIDVKFTQQGLVEFTFENYTWQMDDNPATRALLRAIFTGASGPGIKL